MRKLQMTLIFLLAIVSSPLPAQVTGLSGWNIYLDPGHSRRENMGVHNYSEAEKVLRVGLQLRDILLSETDIDTVYISRTNDEQSVPLNQRTDEANSLAAAWYHSIHSDAGPPSANSTLMLWGQTRDGREKVPNGGKAMSDIMVDILTRAYRTNTRGSIGDCSFYGCSFFGPYLHVNRESTMPSELSEAGFHTNSTQNQRNMNEDWKRLEARAFYWSILRFHGIERPFTGIATGFIVDIETGVPVNGASVTIGDRTYVTDTYESLFNKYSSIPDQLHNGFYYFENMPPGTLDMQVEAGDYYSSSTTVTISDTFFAFRDMLVVPTTPPYVVSTTPTQNSTTFPTFDTPLLINFSRRMNTGSVDSALTFSPPVERRLQWLQGGRQVIVRTDTLQNETTYTLTIAASARDLFDHPFDGNRDGTGGDPFQLRFTTLEPDITPPAVAATYPDDGALEVERRPILNFVFNEPLNPNSIGTAPIQLLQLPEERQVSGSAQHYALPGLSVLSFFPGTELAPATSFEAVLLPGLTDAAGNAISRENRLQFTTNAIDAQVTVIDNFETGLNENWFVPQQSGSTTGIVTEETTRDPSRLFRNQLYGGLFSMRLRYAWDLNAGEWLIRQYLAGGPPREVLFDDSYILQVYVFGDGSGTLFRFAVDDRVPESGAANHEVSPWYTIDWHGWRLVSWDLTNDGTGTWIGDGRLDGTLRFDSFQLSYVDGAATSGAIYFDDLRIIKAVAVGVDEDGLTLPLTHALQQNYPNPFNPETTIRFQVGRAGEQVNLTIYDPLGRVVKRLVDEHLASGEYALRWDGSNAQGAPVASGTYVYRLTIGDFVETRKMVLIR